VDYDGSSLILAAAPDLQHRAHHLITLGFLEGYQAGHTAATEHAIEVLRKS
jgi:hypothetical protein